MPQRGWDFVVTSSSILSKVTWKSKVLRVCQLTDFVVSRGSNRTDATEEQHLYARIVPRTKTTEWRYPLVALVRRTRPPKNRRIPIGQLFRNCPYRRRNSMKISDKVWVCRNRSTTGQLIHSSIDSLLLCVAAVTIGSIVSWCSTTKLSVPPDGRGRKSPVPGGSWEFDRSRPEWNRQERREHAKWEEHTL